MEIQGRELQKRIKEIEIRNYITEKTLEKEEVILNIF